MKHRLVKDRDTGKLCIQIAIGANAATLELPDHLQSASDTELQKFFDDVVPEMIQGLKRYNDEERLRTRWKKGFHG